MICKKNRLLLLFGGLFLTTSLFSQEICVGTFNLRCPVDKEPNDWKTRCPRAIRTIKQAGFDLFGTQELVEKQTKDLLSGTGYQKIGHGRNADKTGEASQIFYNPKRFEVLKQETFWLSETPAKSSVSWGSSLPRIGTIGLFRDKKSNKKFVFANTHLQHQKMLECQKEQLNVLLKRLKPYLDQKIPVILTGDFNSNPQDPAPKLAATLLKDARLISKTPPAGPMKETFHGYNPDPATRKHKERIDYIFVSPDLTVTSFKTIDNFDKNGLASSDHYPLAATIRLP